ncbi:MAG: 1,4-dihydroxy-2-naphthoate polyprenyltransferase [Bacteroidetes bacterium]|nr:1,4-dihydroxy-2-naphthoate polyprenyltransferase [Bacteroidota bacterium]
MKNRVEKLRAWILASRPKTLLASVVPVLVGTSAAYGEGYFNLLAALVALICSLLIQVGTNFVNDLYDFLKGTDNETRLGPIRALASGAISVNEMRLGIFITFALTFIIGLYLVSVAGTAILVVGVVSILAGITYTAGPFPLAYNGLGDVFVFIFFGFVGTLGSYYVQTLQLNSVVFLASIPVGALITNILIVNNYRDIAGDKASGKVTLAVKFGESFTQFQFTFFVIISYLVPIIIYVFFTQRLVILLPLLTFPIALKSIIMIFSLRGTALNNTLELSAKLSSIYGVLFSVGFLL